MANENLRKQRVKIDCFLFCFFIFFSSLLHILNPVDLGSLRARVYSPDGDFGEAEIGKRSVIGPKSRDVPGRKGGRTGGGNLRSVFVNDLLVRPVTTKGQGGFSGLWVLHGVAVLLVPSAYARAARRNSREGVPGPLGILVRGWLGFVAAFSSKCTKRTAQIRPSTFHPRGYAPFKFS